jgi:hypothetical protein
LSATGTRLILTESDGLYTGSMLAPGLSALDPCLPADVIERSQRSTAWRCFHQALDVFHSTAVDCGLKFDRFVNFFAAKWTYSEFQAVRGNGNRKLLLSGLDSFFAVTNMYGVISQSNTHNRMAKWPPGPQSSSR